MDDDLKLLKIDYFGVQFDYPQKMIDNFLGVTIICAQVVIFIYSSPDFWLTFFIDNFFNIKAEPDFNESFKI